MRSVIAGLLGLMMIPSLPAQLTPSPDDWRDTVIYQLLTDRYFDGNPENNNANPTGNRGVMGGDFAGILQRLDHIEGLGCNAIWISPVSFNVAGVYHGYSALHWDQIDPHWGSEEELKALVDECHRRGIRVFFDVICNHMGNLIDSADPLYPHYLAPPEEYVPRWRSEIEYPPPFDDFSMFQIHGEPNDWSGEEGIHGEIFKLDDLRTTDPRVREYLIDLWIDMATRFDVDGFRIDTVKHVEMDFWEEWAPAIHEGMAAQGKENFFLFGEVWNGDPEYIAPYTQPLDSVTDFPRYYTTLGVFAQGSGGPISLEDHWNVTQQIMTPGSRDQLVTFIDNHDVTRFLREAMNASGDDQLVAAKRTMAALVFHLTAPGVPTIYYGTEEAFIGSEEHMGGGGRMPMWDETGDHFNSRHPMYRLISRLNALRRESDALRRGEMIFHRADPEPGILAYSRLHGGEEIMVVINTSVSDEHSTGLLPSTWPPLETLRVLSPHGSGTPWRTDAEGRVESIDLAPLDWWIVRRSRPRNRTEPGASQ